MNYIDFEPPKEKKLKKWIYIIKSYLKIEPCGYCGKANDENVICYKCCHKGG